MVAIATVIETIVICYDYNCNC